MLALERTEIRCESGQAEFLQIRYTVSLIRKGVGEVSPYELFKQYSNAHQLGNASLDGDLILDERSPWIAEDVPHSFGVSFD